MNRSWWLAIVTRCLPVVLITSVAFAQAPAERPTEGPVAPLPPLQALESRAGVSQTSAQLLADQLVILARRAASMEGEHAQVRTRMLLEQAIALTPEDLEIHRLRLWHLRENADEDPAALRQALESYCPMAPDDEAARLELINLQMADLQTTAERIAFLTKHLDATGRDEPGDAMKSRLASMIAAIANEQGDRKLYLKHLHQAMTLDHSNKHAFLMALEEIRKHKSGLLNHGIGWLAVIRSDPVDPAARLALASILLQLREYNGAARQYEAVRNMSAISADPNFWGQWAICLASQGDARSALAMLRELEEYMHMKAQQEAAQKAAEEAAAREDDPFAPPTPETPPAPEPVKVSLPVDLQLLQILMHHQLNNHEMVRSIYGVMRKQLDEKLALERKRFDADVVWWSLFVDEGLGEGGIDLNEAISVLEQELGADAPAIVRIRAWKLMREDARAAARKVLTAHAEEHQFAVYGLALLEEDEGNTSEAVRFYRLAVQMRPDSPLGMCAAMEMHRLKEAIVPDPAAAKLLLALASWPGRVVVPPRGGAGFVDFKMSVKPETVNYLDPIPATITIRNTTDLALSIGDDGVIPAQVWLSVSISREGQSLGRDVLVANIGRRLRLLPNESIEIETRLDRATFGMTLAAQPLAQFGLDVRLVHVQPLERDAQLAPNYLGSTTSVFGLSRRTVPMAYGHVPVLTAAAESNSPTRRMRALALLCRLASLPVPEDNQQAREANQAAASFIERSYRPLNSRMKAWVVRFLPVEREPYREIFVNLTQSSDLLPWIMGLEIHVAELEDPLLQRAIDNQNPAVKRYATAFRQSLEALIKAREEAERAREEALIPAP